MRTKEFILLIFHSGSRQQCSQIADEIYPLHTYQFGAANENSMITTVCDVTASGKPKMYEDERFELVISRRPRLDRLFEAFEGLG